MIWRGIQIAIVLSFLAPAFAQSADQTRRQAAVALDRLDAPPPEDPALHIVASGLDRPWSMAFLPDGGILVTEKYRGLRLIDRNGTVGPLLSGMPENVLKQEDSGFLDVALDPDFKTNGRVYLAYVDGTLDANRTAVWRAEFAQSRLKDGETIFRTNVAKKGPSHPGGRLAFLPDRTMLLTVGDGYDFRDAAQDRQSHLGKILRLDRDGRAPIDNPFTGRTDAAREIWSLGHRNIQGLFVDPQDGTVWSHEHGPRGGDEVNVIKPGENYGWPLVCLGIDYDGKLISERAFAPGIEPPKFFWSPSIAPSGLTRYRGDRYPGFDGKLFVGGLAARSLIRLRTGRQTGLLIEDARMFTNFKTRIRDVRTGPDRYLYLLTDEEKTAKLLRLGPAL